MTREELANAIMGLNVSILEIALKRLVQIEPTGQDDGLLQAWNEVKEALNVECKPLDHYQAMLKQWREEQG